MAYAEKRGKGPRPWRVKYKLPDGNEDSRSGFETKNAALTWGRDQESRIREGRWTDPKSGLITVNEWIDRWRRIQDVGISTINIREYMLRRFILPAWGNRAMDSLSNEEITEWENGLPAATGVSRRTARAARSVLCTILGDAAAARPPLIPYNPALRPRNRGRKTGRRIERSPQRVWATPHEVLLIAERAALLSGSDDEFTLVITIGYTGMRWGEAIGLEREYFCDSLINVEWQLREVGTFHRLPPKDDSYRSANWEPGVPVDLPPFLAGLLSQQISERPPRPCACAGRHGGSGRYVFLGPDGGHHRRGRYAQRLFRPACDGRYASPEGLPGKTVIVDASAWPGRPVAAWPSADPSTGPTAGFTPPRGRGIRRIAEEVPVACWLPVKQGLTPHGLRHSHKTWMEEDGISGILQERRLGHEVPGMRGLYTHVSQAMRTELTEALQNRWEDSLRARAAIAPHSPVPLLDQLLAPYRAPAERLAASGGRRQAELKLISQIPPTHERSSAAALR
jgi:integrase